jgi:tetratricopeptide (TPR) repeat protein
VKAAFAVAALVVACARTPAPQPPSIDVRSEIERAETAEKARKHDVARVHYERAVANARDPASISFARREYAETLISWGEYPAAIAQLEAALAARPEDPAAWHNLGMLRHNQGDAAGAIAALERARDLAPKKYDPRVALAALRWKLDDRQGALAEYKALLELELPERLRKKVEWAIGVLTKPAAPAGPPAER